MTYTLKSDKILAAIEEHHDDVFTLNEIFSAYKPQQFQVLWNYLVETGMIQHAGFRISVIGREQLWRRSAKTWSKNKTQIGDQAAGMQGEHV